MNPRWTDFETHIDSQDDRASDPATPRSQEAQLAAWLRAGGDLANQAPASQQSFAAVQARIRHRPAQAMLASRRSARRWLGGISAACVAMLAVYAGLSWQQRSPAGYTVLQEYHTANAEHTTVELPDGSRVTLAPATQLKFVDAHDDTRTVILTGQAYFRIQENHQAPFVVRTASSITRVLGTEFDVRQYESDTIAQIAVVTGKVASQTNSAEESVTLSANMIAWVTDSSARSTSGDARAVADWSNGYLTFSEVPIGSMLQTLSRWYGYEFRLADSALAKRHVSTVLSIGKPDEVLGMLKEVLDVSVSVSGNIVTLRRTSVPARHPDSLAPLKRETSDVLHNTLRNGK